MRIPSRSQLRAENEAKWKESRSKFIRLNQASRARTRAALENVFENVAYDVGSATRIQNLMSRARVMMSGSGQFGILPQTKTSNELINCFLLIPRAVI